MVPWRDRPATEFTLQAWSGGIVGLGRGSAGTRTGIRRRPGRRLSGRALTASAATLASRLRQHRGSGEPGELIDLSMLETQILGLTYYPVTYFEMLGRPWRDARQAHRSGSRPCERRSGGRRVWHSAAMVRSMCDGRSAGLDRRGLATVDHRDGQRYTPKRSIRGSRADRSTTSANSQRHSGFPTRRWPTAPISHRAGPLPAAGLVCRQSARRVPAAGPPLPDAARDSFVASSGTAARGTHRALPGRQHDSADAADAFGACKRDCRSADFGCWT